MEYLSILLFFLGITCLLCSFSLGLHYKNTQNMIDLILCALCIIISFILLILSSVLNNINNQESNHIQKLNIEEISGVIEKNKKTFDDENNIECPICLELIKTDGVLLKCEHAYHSECLTKWLLINNSCAFCRNTIK